MLTVHSSPPPSAPRSRAARPRSLPVSILLAAWAATSLACASLGGPAGTPVPTLPAPETWHTPAPGSSVITPPALADGLLVYLTDQGIVEALDAASGQEKWHYVLEVSDDTHRPLAVVNGVVLVDNKTPTNTGKDTTSVLGIDLHSGQALWDTSLSPSEGALFFYQPTAANGVAYYESETGPGHRQLTAADPTTGQVKWQSPLTGTALAGDPAFDGGLIFAPIDHPGATISNSVTTDLLALDEASGAPRWTTMLGSLADDILAAGGGRVFATTKDGNLWAIDGASGKVDWKFPFDDDQPAPPLLAGDTLYFGDGQGRLYALDAATGTARWTAHLGQSVERRPAVGGGRVYVGSGDGNLNALDAATGNVIWKTQNHLQHPFAANPYIPPLDTEPVYAHGMLYFFNVEELIALQVP